MYPNTTSNTHSNHSSASAHVDAQAHENSHPRDSESQIAVSGTISSTGGPTTTTVVPHYSSNVLHSSNASFGSSGIPQALQTVCTVSAPSSVSSNLELHQKDRSGENHNENYNGRRLNVANSNMAATGIGSNAFPSCTSAARLNSQGTSAPIQQKMEVTVPNPLASSVPNPLATMETRPLNHPNASASRHAPNSFSFQGSTFNSASNSIPVVSINHEGNQRTALQSSGVLPGSNGSASHGQPRRKLVLSAEGREALTKAVVSSLKDPRGIMDPVLLEAAMRATQLSREAILNAAKLAREKENLKRRAQAAATASAPGVTGVFSQGTQSLSSQQRQQQQQQHSNQSSAMSQPQVYAHSRPQSQMQSGSQLQRQPQGSLQSRPQSQMQPGLQPQPQLYRQPGSQPQSQASMSSGSKVHVSMQQHTGSQSQYQQQQQQQQSRAVLQSKANVYHSAQSHAAAQLQPPTQTQIYGQSRPKMPMTEPWAQQAYPKSKTQANLPNQMQPRLQPPLKESGVMSNLSLKSGSHGQSQLQARPQMQPQLPPQAGAPLQQNVLPRQQGYPSHGQFQPGSKHQSYPQSMNQTHVPRPLDSKPQNSMPIRREARPQSSSYSKAYTQPRTNSMPQVKPHLQAATSIKGQQQKFLVTGKTAVPYAKIPHAPTGQAPSHPHPTLSSLQKPPPQTQQLPQSQNQFRAIATPKKTTSPTKFEMQMKAAKEAAVTFHQEMSQWKRIQHGIFLTAVEGNVQQNPIKTCSLGAISRISDVRPVLKEASTSQSIDEDFRNKVKALQREVLAVGRVDGVAPKEYFTESSPNSVSTSLFSHRFTHTKVSLIDVTEKHKRIKLQSRKDSRALERNLRKHRHVVCELMLKKQKELHRSILQHSTDFYKYHRQRKAELSKFSKSVRDYVAAEQRKKEKDSVNEEKARIAALKANDMEAYSALVQETRNDRLKFLLDKTDEYIDQISGLLKDQHDGKIDSSELTTDTNNGVQLFGASRLPAVEQANSNYYKTAHVHKEDVKQPSILVGGKLKEYQLSGLQWLISLYNNKLNGILADEMGLGKTVQTIALIAYLMEYKDNRGPYLVIVPLSTLSNWVNEFRRWCPTATVVVYKGTPAQRKGLYKAEVMQGHFNVLLTTYEYIIKDKSSLRKLQWEYAIVDEGHRMKNAQSKFAVTLGTQYVTKHRVLLTGTPLQNNLPELWSLLNFLLPTIFNSAETFDQWFNKPFAQFGTSTADGETEETVNNEERLLIIQRLHELLRPFMLRRIKSDVLDQLPDKVEKVLRCELSSWQKELYKQISYSVLEDGQKKSKRGLNNVVMQLRKVCNHPYMFTPEGYYITEDIIRTSGKFELLDRMLPKLKAAGHRILMFFQMTAAMTIMEDYLKYRNILSLRLDGSTTGEERERRMDLFNAPNSPYFIFMLSTRAGGLGLNLVSADTVIIFDSDWNPMMDLQAQDRAHRIGQKKIVSVFRLITNSPVEEKILSRATEKLNMSELVVEAGKFDRDSVEEDNVEERQKIMEILLTDFDSTAAKGSTTGTTSSLPTSEDDLEGNGDSDEKEEIDINELLSRNDEDYEFYSKMDSGEIDAEDYFKSPGLVTDPNDIPDWIRYPHGKKEQGDGEFDEFSEAGKRRAASKATAYDDGLTEKQFLRIMEKQAEVEEQEAKARKREWKLARDKKAIENAVNARSTSTSPIPEETSNRLISMTRSIIAIRDPKTNRRYSDIFREKPSEADYPEYYKLIEQPIAINDILKRCRLKSYASAAEYHQDWKLMFSNAVKFNGENSWVVMDGKVLEVELNRLLKKYGLLEEVSKMPASSPKKKKPRLKLSLKLSMKRKNESESTSNDNKKVKLS